MTSLTLWVLRHKRAVAGFWAVVTIVGIATVSQVTGAFSNQFSAPGREGFVTNAAIAKLFGNGGQNEPLLAVITLPAGTRAGAPSVLAGVRRLEARLRTALPGSRTASFADTHNRAFVSADGRTTFVLAYPRADRSGFGDNTAAAAAATAAVGGFTVAGRPVAVTGFPALRNSAGGSGGGPGVLLESLLGGLGALVVLAFVFASLLAFVPIVMAVVSIMTTFLLLWALTTVTTVSFIVEFLVALIGLGVAIDYCLLIVVRWREERAHGLTGEEAVLRTMATAGRAVVFSGSTVAIGLLAMVVLPLPFLRSIGYAGMLIPFVSVVVATTLLPVVLLTLGQRLDWPHRRSDERASRAWTSWARLVVRGRWAAAAAALVVLALLVIAATNLQPGTPNADALSSQGPARAGLATLERSGIGAGALTPVEILAPTDGARTLETRLADVAGLHGAVAPTVPGWSRAGRSVIDAFPVADGSTDAGRTGLTRVRATAHAAVRDSRVGGAGAQNADFVSAIYGSFPEMIALIVVLTLVLLARAFGSLLLPIKAVILNIISVGAAWGVVTLVWQDGHGSDQIFGIPATHSVTAWIPLMIFAFLFGLSMDYEVFILARMREEYDATGDTDAAVVRGIGRTGRLVTSAALILFLAFISLASGPETDVKVFATGLAAGILLDATVIRALLVPAVVSLIGRWNWWLPAPTARVLRVAPSVPAEDLAPASADRDLSGDAEGATAASCTPR